MAEAETRDYDLWWTGFMVLLAVLFVIAILTGGSNS
jgi:hypothetical protein